MNEATLTTYPTGTNIATEVHDIRLRDGDYIEATILPGGERGDYDTKIITFGYLPINEQNIHEHMFDHDEMAYHPDGVYFTKIGSCDNRGAEKLWQFQLFPEVQNGIVDDWVVETDDHDEDGTEHNHEDHEAHGEDHEGHEHGGFGLHVV